MGPFPPPRRHRHHYHGILAPHSPLRPKITNNSLPIRSPNENNPVQNEDLPFLLPEPIEKKEPLNSQLLSSQSDITPTPPTQEPVKKAVSKASLYRWAMLMARIFEVFPLSCPKCTHPMRIIAFIQDRPTIRKILGSHQRTV